MKRIIPKFILQILLPLLNTTSDIFFQVKYGFWPPIRGSDLVGYEILLDFIKQHHLLDLGGDVVEIGTFLGGGANKLAKFLERERSSKILYVIDIFDPNFDWTLNTSGIAMANIYNDLLTKFNERSQQDVFLDINRDCTNIECLIGDSKEIEIPSNQFCFGFIDGNHNPEYVESDFYLIWNKLVSRGAIAFHDYEWDLPQTTAKINELVGRHVPEIQNIYHNKDCRS